VGDVSELKPSAWAQTRFGGVAGDMARVVACAVHQAHGLAMDAHISSTLRSNDAYGATLHVTQYEQLAEFARDIPGISIRRPTDVRCRFELVVLDYPPVVLYPWRYATDKSTLREKAKLRPPVSDLRKTLLTLNANTISVQLTLDQAERDLEELEAELADEQAVVEQLARFGQVVTVGFASNPAGGIFDLGWGDVELVDEEAGGVIWRHWEQLPPPGDQAAGGEPRQPLSPPDGRDRTGRFDDAPLKEDLGLVSRSPIAEPPISEPERPQEDTGSDEPS
jgi:hypothetical protein